MADSSQSSGTPEVRLAEAAVLGAEIADDLAAMSRLATLGGMTAGIAHEINNLLTPVLGFAQIAARHPEDADLQRRAMEKVVSGVEAASQIARAILGFSHDDGVAAAEVSGAVDDALACLGRDLGKDGIELRREIGRDLVCAISATALQQVLLNLVLNARRAMGEQARERTLTIRAWVGEAAECAANKGPSWPQASEDESSPAAEGAAKQGLSWPRAAGASGGRGAERRNGGVVGVARTAGRSDVGEMVMIEMSDSGPGIPEGLRGRLFDRFVSGGDSGSSRGNVPTDVAADRSDGLGGHGLGLAVCRQLVEQAGGWIDEVSGAGEGAKFLIALPRGVVGGSVGLAKAG